MVKKIFGIGGSAANPPHLGHTALLKALIESGNFATIIWIPSGERGKGVNFAGYNERQEMIHRLLDEERIYELAKGNGIEFILHLHDLFFREFTPTITWFEIYKSLGNEIVWYTGVDSVVPDETGLCEIEREWQDGKVLLAKYPFLIVPRAGYPHPRHLKLPEQFYVLDAELPDISSTHIRELIARGDPEFEKYVGDSVAAFIKEEGLYGWRGGR